MAFTLIRNLLELDRYGNKRLLLALYSASDGSSLNEQSDSKRYLALSEQEKSSDGQWISRKRGITVRKGEVEAVIKALQSADFDANPDGKNLTPQEYADKFLRW